MGNEMYEFAFFSTANEAISGGFTIVDEDEFRQLCGRNRASYRAWVRQHKRMPIKAIKFPKSTT